MEHINPKPPRAHVYLVEAAQQRGYKASYSIMTQLWRLRDKADQPVLREGKSGFTYDEVLVFLKIKRHPPQQP